VLTKGADLLFVKQKAKGHTISANCNKKASQLFCLENSTCGLGFCFQCFWFNTITKGHTKGQCLGAENTF